jgi:SAM-dependent methyltransferase
MQDVIYCNKKVLNVGGNNKSIPIPACFDGWQHDLLDIDSSAEPDILCDARELWRLPPREYDAIYCSHNLEHYFAHDVDKVLKGFRLLLKLDGFAYIKVPNLIGVMKHVVEHSLELDGELYTLPAIGSFTALDVIFGYQKQIESSGVDFYAHKTGFSAALLQRLLKAAGFPLGYTLCDPLEITAFAFKMKPSVELVEQLGLGELVKVKDETDL